MRSILGSFTLAVAVVLSQNVLADCLPTTDSAAPVPLASVKTLYEAKTALANSLNPNPAPHAVKWTIAPAGAGGAQKLKIADAQEMILLDVEGRPATATIPLGAEVFPAKDDADALQIASEHPNAWILVGAKEIGQRILESLSVSVGVTQSGTLQDGLPGDIKLLSPSGTVQFNLKAKSLPFVNGSDNKYVRRIIDGTSINIGFYDLCLGGGCGPTHLKDLGPGAGRMTNLNLSGQGGSHGGYVEVQEEIPFTFLGVHVPLYASGGMSDEIGEWQMMVRSSGCVGATYSTGCPKTNRPIYYADDGSVMGERATLGLHTDPHGSVEISGTAVKSYGLLSKSQPMFQNTAYSIEYRRGF